MNSSLGSNSFISRNCIFAALKVKSNCPLCKAPFQRRSILPMPLLASIRETCSQILDLCDKAQGNVKSTVLSFHDLVLVAPTVSLSPVKATRSPLRTPSSAASRPEPPPITLPVPIVSSSKVALLLIVFLDPVSELVIICLCSRNRSRVHRNSRTPCRSYRVLLLPLPLQPLAQLLHPNTSERGAVQRAALTALL